MPELEALGLDGLGAGIRPPRTAELDVVRAALHAPELTPAHERALSALEFAGFLGALAELVPEASQRLVVLGVPDRVRADFWADVGRKVRAYGDNGIREWLVTLLRGDVLQLGRLQFERAVGPQGRAVHIPELGPLTPELVDDSLEQARRFFADRAGFACTSWLLDPRLVALGGDSNIVRFQRRFELVAGVDSEGEDRDEGDADVAKFVFGVPLAQLDRRAVTPATALQRVVAEVWRSGRRWFAPTGVLRP
ncbi:acyltransferase domain-containing protein [Gryllotalpicola daejeonensis]|uniref:Acyltransferase domain-containing protein n=1 Tax=Gryllotalpicola daejeonensis TaxID=993087 RepID=A0ABP7ZNS4_9MICO